MSRAYYNEFDPYVAQWLRNLIAAGLIAPGDVDERSIEDVTPSDLKHYTQCHFFAGVGVWSLSLRRAGWSDDRPVWTGSCPCQPFSAAGQGAGFADERHLWPAFHHLIGQCSPAVVFGEQVASKDADPWIDLVQDDLEALGYAVGAVPFPSAGIGAPHIRDRLYWVADSNSRAGGKGRADVRGRVDGSDAQPRSGLGGSGLLNRLGDSGCAGLAQRFGQSGISGSTLGADPGETVVGAGICTGGLANMLMQQRPDGQAGICIEHAARGRDESAAATSGLCGDLRAGPTNGFWRDADWLFCRDGKWRPVEPGTFPLAHGAAARVGRLRAYGNAINAEAAEAFICSYLETC